MLWFLVALLIILWALGYFAFSIAGGFIHLLLVLAIIIIIYNFVVARRAGPPA